MKKFIFTLCCSCSLLGLVSSQSTSGLPNDAFRTSIYAGIKMGFNLANVYDTKGDQFVADPALGFAAGLFLAVPIGSYFGVHPEILFSQKGFRSTGRILGGTYELRRTSSYLDIPLLLAIKPISMLTILIGPQYSFLLQQKNVYKSGSTTIAQQQEFSNESVRKNTLCFIGGIDLNFSKLVVGLRTGWDIQNNSADGVSTTPRYKNYWYQATLGLRF